MATRKTDYATFTKLKDGSWGVKGHPSDIQEQAPVLVRTKSGNIKGFWVRKVLWTNDTTSIGAGRTISDSELAAMYR